MRFELLASQGTHISARYPLFCDKHVHFYNCPQKNKVELTETLNHILVHIGIKIYSAIRFNGRVDRRISIRETNVQQYYYVQHTTTLQQYYYVLTNQYENQHKKDKMFKEVQHLV